jgi:Leucine-rich repeat (LRR) protein
MLKMNIIQNKNHAFSYDSFSHIIYLNCENNSLTALPDHLPHSLKKLDFSYNDISQLPEKLNNYKILFT